MWNITYLCRGRLSGKSYGIYTYRHPYHNAIRYYFNDKKHRLDGPADINYEFDKITDKHFIINDKIHRFDGPAIIEYYESGIIFCEEYYVNGNRHRLHHPCVIWYDKSGEIEDYIKNEI